jgi:hypothetical protein
MNPWRIGGLASLGSGIVTAGLDAVPGWLSGGLVVVGLLLTLGPTRDRPRRWARRDLSSAPLPGDPFESVDGYRQETRPSVRSRF